MTKRAQLDYVQIDVDFFDKPRVQALIEELGPNAALYLLRIYLAIGRGAEARLPKKYAISLYRSVAVTKEIAEQTIIYSIQEELLQEDGDFLTLKRIEEDQERVQQKRDKWRGAKQGQRAHEGEKERTGEGQGEDKGRTLNTEDLNTEDLNNKKEIVENFSAPGETDPPRPPHPLLLGKTNSILEKLLCEPAFANGGGVRFVTLNEISAEQTLANWLSAGLERDDFKNGLRAFDAWKGKKLQEGRYQFDDDACALTQPWVMREAVSLKNEIEKLKRTRSGPAAKKINWANVWERKQ